MAKRNDGAPINQAATSGVSAVRADGTASAPVEAPVASEDTAAVTETETTTRAASAQPRVKPPVRSLEEKDAGRAAKEQAAKYNGVQVPPTEGQPGDVIALRRVKNGKKGFIEPGDVLNAQTVKLLEREEGLTLKL